MRSGFFLVMGLMLLGCSHNERPINEEELHQQGLKTLDGKTFTIIVPEHWAYVEARGIDSFVGDIKINDSTILSSDLSEQGYANSLVPSEQDHQNNKERYVSELSKTKAHNFKLSESDKYTFKMIWPKSIGKGMTGIYVHSRNSSFDFQMNGRDLSQTDQTAALAAFKTIKFKRDEK